MEEFPSNSYKKKPPKNLKKVISGDARIQQKSVIRKFVDIFIPEDVEDVKEYVIYDILIPSAKNLLSDTVNAYLFGKGSKNSSQSGVRIIDYTKASSNRGREYSRRDPDAHQEDNSTVVVRTRADAEAVLSEMDNILDVYGIVTVSNFNELVGIRSKNYTDNNYGWENIASAKVVPVRNGYEIRLPKAILIN